MRRPAAVRQAGSLGVVDRRRSRVRRRRRGRRDTEVLAAPELPQQLPAPSAAQEDRRRTAAAPPIRSRSDFALPMYSVGVPSIHSRSRRPTGTGGSFLFHQPLPPTERKRGGSPAVRTTTYRPLDTGNSGGPDRSRARMAPNPSSHRQARSNHGIPTASPQAPASSMLPGS